MSPFVGECLVGMLVSNSILENLSRGCRLFLYEILDINTTLDYQINGQNGQFIIFVDNFPVVKVYFLRDLNERTSGIYPSYYEAFLFSCL